MLLLPIRPSLLFMLTHRVTKCQLVEVTKQD